MAKRLREEETNQNLKSSGFFSGLKLSLESAFNLCAIALGFQSDSTPMELKEENNTVTTEETQDILEKESYRAEDSRTVFKNRSNQPSIPKNVQKKPKPYQMIVCHFFLFFILTHY